MSNTMTAAHEPIHYLDSILNEEEKRCDQYSHQWRNFTISRSGRFRSKNKKRDVVDGKLFDGSGNHNGKENDKISARNASSAMSKTSSYPTSTPTAGSASTAAGTATVRSQRDKTESYKSFYETNL